MAEVPPAGGRALLGDRVTEIVELSPAFTSRFAAPGEAVVEAA
jgi:hypothetical protein